MKPQCAILILLLSGGLSSGFAQSGNATLDSYFATYLPTYKIPGAAACIIKKNQIAWQGYYGSANLARNIPVSETTVFSVASLGKSMIATAIMQLSQAGRLNLSDSINAHLPFRVANPLFPGTPITIRMLMTHTSSIEDNWNLDVMNSVPGDPLITLAGFLESYLTPGGMYYRADSSFSKVAPGTRWSYSNVAASLAAFLVERVSGTPFSKYCADSIFAPLTMSNTSWYLHDLDTLLVAHPYGFSGGAFVDYGLTGSPIYPAGQLRITLPSLARFLLANIRGGEVGGQRILDTASVRLLRTDYVTLSSTVRWGLFWYRQRLNSKNYWGFVGQTFGVTAAMFLSEADSLGVILLTNGEGDPAGGITALLQLLTVAGQISVDVPHAGQERPTGFALEQNYPNPFNPETTIAYSVPATGPVRLAVCDLLGREVAVLVNETKQPGRYGVELNASQLSSGTYFYRLNAGSETCIKKMMVLK